MIPVLQNAWSFFVIILFFGVVSAENANIRAADLTNPIKPSDDPFYNPPSFWQEKPPGSILRYRHTPAPPGFLHLEQNLQKSLQILYTATDSHGDPEATVLTVYVPYEADYTKLLSFQAMMDSSDFDCSTSYTLQVNSDSSGARQAQRKNVIMEVVLNKGWIVIVPDYEGPKAAFTAGIQAGHAVLDGIRAFLQSEAIIGINPDANVCLWGYSDGSSAAGWAAELQSRYYPELTIAGVAVGGLITNITAVALSANNGGRAGLVASGITGLANEYPDFDTALRASLKPATADVLLSTTQMCINDAASAFDNQEIFKYSKNGEDVLLDPTIKRILDENALGEHIPESPMYIYHCQNDVIAPIENTLGLFDYYCSKGVDIIFHENTDSSHSTESIFGLPGAVLWLADRMNGKASKPGCNHITVASNVLDWDSIEFIAKNLIDLIKGILGRPIGTKDGFDR
ncbi:hypothetical protein TRVA0_047S00474 [Trichomonascus vanleenenianus]|uniref:uncharacterized protein n=1 Tax=Trichomonascus vanleenenianus TaxID=2268995 RepID=UPI003ECB5C11